MHTRLPDPARSFAVLIGVSRYRHLDDLPTVRDNLVDLRAALTDPGLGGLPPDRCELILDPPDAGHVLQVLHDRAERAGDTLLIYFAGHGLAGHRSGELHLAMRDTHPDRPFVTALNYRDIREIFLASPVYPSASRVVVLDCCYSGRALMSGDVLGMIEISGTYVMTATRWHQAALATSPDGRHTRFTGELLRVLEKGIPGPFPLLSLHAIYHQIQLSMRAQNLPEPSQLNKETVGNLALARNRAFDPAAPVPVPPQAPPPAAPAVPMAVAGRALTAARPVAPAPSRPSMPAVSRRPRRYRMLWVVVLLAALGFAVQQAVVNKDEILGWLPSSPFTPARQITVDAVGQGPWKVEGYGYRFELTSIKRTTNEGPKSRHQASITITGYVTVTEGTTHSRMQYTVTAKDGTLLENVPFTGSGTGNPPVNQRTKLVLVDWDTNPRTKAVTVVIHDFFWPQGKDLILRNVPVT
ncbi:caspase domain-containing protein [Krasilnikovia cinnamomea]|uniref:Caspase domain-containing protein n=1 Tax=Krasilnikovia cinnamomea TaxID=349313 RepID=A0A4V2G6N6_9ACTN|nr:caspase family protein [Krasilnikovia cinnamomea]RZU49406.1 caspase domain-containing protein [Krasilnikovia cinnamomea]